MRKKRLKKVEFLKLKGNLQRLNLTTIKTDLKSNYLPAIKNKNELTVINKNQKAKTKLITIVLSFFAGIINGLFGGGAGMLIVPILEKVNKLKTKTAHATAVLIVLPLCAFSVIAYLIAGKYDFSNAISVVAGVVTGGLIGAFLLNKLNSKIIRYFFSFIVFGAGLKLFIDTLIGMF